MTKYISIDQSYTSCGVVLFEDEKIVDVIRITTDKTLSKFERVHLIVSKIIETTKTFNPAFVALEGLAFGMRGSATRDLAGLQFHLVIMLEVIHGIKTHIVAPLTVKKFATGKGRSSKEELYEKVPDDIKEYFTKTLGLKKSKGLYDITDAYFIGLYCFKNQK